MRDDPAHHAPMNAPDALPLADLDDATLLRRHQAGSADTFGELFRRHKDRMWAVAIRTLGDREAAADCVQEAFISAFRRADSFRGDSAVTTWLHRIVVNACIDRIRRDRQVLGRTIDVSEVDRPDPHDHHCGAETALVVRDALAQLPEPQRLALVLVDMHGFSVSEAAEVLEVAEGTIKSRCSRGRTALADILGPQLRAASSVSGTNVPAAPSEPRPDTAPGRTSPSIGSPT